MGSDTPNSAENTPDKGDRQRRADALRALAEGAQAMPNADMAAARKAPPLRLTANDWLRHPLVWGSATLIGVIIIAVIVSSVWRGSIHAGASPVKEPLSVIQFPFSQIACPASESWSPDGKTLAVIGYVNCGSSADELPPTTPVLALFDSITGQIRSTFILQDIASRAIPLAQLGDFDKPTWSLNGQNISIPFEYFIGAHTSAFGLVVVDVSGSTRVIVPPTPLTNAGMTYDRYGTGYIFLPQTVRFDLTIGSATPMTSLSQAFAYTWKSAGTLTPTSLSAQPVASTILPSSISGYLSYFCSSSGGASYLFSAGGAAWSPDDRYFYSTLGAYGVVSGPQPAGASSSGTACVTSKIPAGWQSITAPLKGFDGVERDFQQVGSDNGLMFATSPSGSRIAAVESDSVTPSNQSTQVMTTIRIYDGVAGTRQAQLSLQQLLTADHIRPQSPNDSYLQQIAWSPDGHSLALLDTQDLAIIILGPSQLG